MRIFGILIAAVMLSAGITLIPGCGAQGGRTIMTQGGSAEPVMGTAPDSGMYKLYTAAALNPTATQRVNQGDPLGFRRADDGHLIAVAGSQTYDLPKGTMQAYWKLGQ